jgi:hypothetical protein
MAAAGSGAFTPADFTAATFTATAGSMTGAAEAMARGGVGLGLGLYPYYGYYEGSQPYAAQYWYYCSDPAGYYPQVAQCNTAWQTVPAG